ncbi:MAG: PBSX family phage terminase large subunit [bacterium]|nr:PBSX family phage terminase large subunit [bacterium]
MDFDLTNLPGLVSPAFWPLIPDPSRYLVMWGGAGSSKSYTAAQKVITRAIATPGHKFVCCRKFATSVRGSVYELLREVLSSWDFLRFVHVHKQDMEFTFPNGSRILCRGLDDREKLKSIPGITGFWLEEPTELEQEDLLQCDLRLRGATPGYKQIMFSFNPVVISNWIHAEFFEEQPGLRIIDGHTQRYKRGAFDVTLHHSTFADNPFIDDAYRQVLENLASASKLYYTVYKLGLWGSPEGTIYYAFSRATSPERAANVDPSVEMDNILPLCWAMDFNIGAGKPMSSCICQVRKGRNARGKVRTEIHVIDEIILDTADTNDAAREFKMREWFTVPEKVIVYGDAAGRAKDTRSKTTDYEILRAAGFSNQDVPRANPPIRDRHNAVNTMLCSADNDVRVRIHPRCKTLIKGLETVKCKPGASYTEEETREQHVTTGFGYFVNRICPVREFVPSGQRYWK